MEDIVDFLGLIVLNFDVHVFSARRNAQNTTVEKPQLKIISFQNYNFLSDEALKGTVL